MSVIGKYIKNPLGKYAKRPPYKKQKPVKKPHKIGSLKHVPPIEGHDEVCQQWGFWDIY